MPRVRALSVVFLSASLSLYAQTKLSASKQARLAAQAPAEPTISIAKVIVQEPQAQEARESYWTRFFSPENLPNILLVMTGIAGVVIAIYTLKTIERQSKATEDSVEAMRLQTIYIEKSVNIAEKLMLLEHRANLVLGCALLENIYSASTEVPMYAQCFFLNKGDSKAQMTECRASVDPLGSVPMIGDLKPIPIPPEPIEPSQGLRVPVLVSEPVAQKIRSVISDKLSYSPPYRTDIILSGTCRYTDELGHYHAFNFFWNFNPVTEQFHVDETMKQYAS
jgi:hypothetical protein